MADDRPPLSSFTTDGSGDKRPPLDSFYAPQKNQETSLGDVALGAVVNTPKSALNLAKSTVQPFLHPIETAQNLGRVAAGVGSKLGIPGAKDYEPYANAVGQFFANRYGGVENVKQTIMNDPVGFVADVATVLTAGGGLAERVPGIVGDIGEATRAVGTTINPFNVAQKGASKAVDIGAEALGNMGTGGGATGLRNMARSGFAGSKEALANMREPELNAANIVPWARQAFEQVRLERSADYTKAMAALGQRANKPLKFDQIEAAINKEQDAIRFEGHDTAQIAGENKPTPAQQMLDDIKRNVQAWKLSAVPNVRSAAGFDQLKQHIGQKIDWRGGNDNANRVAKSVYNAIKETIVEQDPKYAEIMQDYTEASERLNELEKTLSVGKRASEDTALRKLLSTTRSGVNTNFGRRAELAEILNQYDPRLIPALAGQSFAGWTPQGLVGKGIAGAIGTAAAYGGHPMGALALPFTSPRLVGEAAYGLGAGARKINELTPKQIKEILGRVNPNVLKQVLLLMSRGDQNASQ